MPKPPSPAEAERIRLTITVTPEVHAAFQRMSEVSGLSLGRCMGDWLGDTLEGVEFITGQLAKARQAPRQVAQELRQHLLGALDEADEVIAGIRSGKVGLPPTVPAAAAAGDASAPQPPARPGAGRGAPPRPVIRGGKSPNEGQRARGGKGSGGRPKAEGEPDDQ